MVFWFACFTGGAGHICNDERADGQYVLLEAGSVCRMRHAVFVFSMVHSGFSGVVTGSRKLLPVTPWLVASGYRRDTRKGVSLVTAK